ncbi:hypothetical protein PROFUN_08662 [Planoprotostelium fungivorum]|uniref:Uncharacterized protein n=1 Tax=Planoprotostelium fungivorum TaxID=1890364 RepID=A0A2P6NJ39_9EUKA|nr:hypothetical protein PROFUN_08662 [Planoprotostelium fungivorum]
MVSKDGPTTEAIEVPSIDYLPTFAEDKAIGVLKESGRRHIYKDDGSLMDHLFSFQMRQKMPIKRSQRNREATCNLF